MWERRISILVLVISIAASLVQASDSCSPGDACEMPGTGGQCRTYSCQSCPPPESGMCYRPMNCITCDHACPSPGSSNYSPPCPGSSPPPGPEGPPPPPPPPPTRPPTPRPTATPTPTPSPEGYYVCGVAGPENDYGECGGAGVCDYLFCDCNTVEPAGDAVVCCDDEPEEDC